MTLRYFVARIVLFFAIIFTFSLVISSCVKDRIQPVVVVVPPPIDTIPTTDTTSAALSILDYWNFNSGDTSTMLKPNTGNASISYTAGYFDAVSGTDSNARNMDGAGDALRMRNPFASITFLMPTTGYKSAVFTFATQRSNSGPTTNNVFYTVDGNNFINDSLAVTSVSLDTSWAVHTINFSAIKRVNNNSKFAIQLITGDNNTGTSGNDRYDNVTLEARKQ